VVAGVGFFADSYDIFAVSLLTIPETLRYTFDVARDVEKAADDVEAYVAGKSEGHPDEISRVQAKADADQMVIPRPASKISLPTIHSGRMEKSSSARLGDGFCRMCRFLFTMLENETPTCNSAFYGLSLNPIILQAIGYTGCSTVYKMLLNTALGNMIIVLAGAIPGYWVTVATVDTLGRKPIQLGGFAILTIIFIVMGFAYNHLSSHVLLGLYVVAQFVSSLPQAAIAPLRVRGEPRPMPTPGSITFWRSMLSSCSWVYSRHCAFLRSNASHSRSYLVRTKVQHRTCRMGLA
jgi:PHS family inorganic phosphate transporter-like MFS transporter